MIQHLLDQEDKLYLRKISVKDFSSTLPPKSLSSHQHMNATDKDIWDCSYVEEYFGLHSDAHTWQYITEQEYLDLKPHMGHALPTIALATIKPDEYGKLQ
eukprot:861664-Ditylum_brightwellii.AAC.1